MIPFSNLSVLDNAFNTRSQRLTAAALVATAAALVIATTWLVSSLIGGTSPATVVGPAPNEAVYVDQGLRSRAAAPVAESYPDMGLRNAAGAAANDNYIDFGQRHPPAGSDR
ncbi:hypothetical protein BH24CHL6_BH24CHL6_16620 [soil metagenome]